MQTTDNTAITHHNGGTTLTGDAISLYRTKVLEQSIRLWIKTGMIPTRGATIKYMLGEAAKITRKTYKNTPVDRERAADDLKLHCDTLRAAIPDIDQRTR